MRLQIALSAFVAASLSTTMSSAQEPAAAPPAATPAAPPPAVASVPAASASAPAAALAPPPAPTEAPASSAYPRVGGHFGTALPIATFGRETTVIGSDFVTLGLTPGITVHLDDKWAIDFEFIALNEVKNTPSPTTFVVDPGVVRKFDGFTAGLRVATRVGAPTNGGLVPIFVLPVAKLGDKTSWFLELDLPLFIRDGGDKMNADASVLFQSGVGF